MPASSASRGADGASGGAVQPAIACHGVSFSHDGVTRALDGVDLTIAPGEFVCLLGGNGSGKSTLARHLNALLVPDEGVVEIEGRDTARPENVLPIRACTGMVFQNPDDQLVASLIEGDIAFGPENLGIESTEIAARVEAALREVGLQGFGAREVHALSGGQKQRVAIAGILAMRPRIFVLDEATSMLDPRGRRGLMRLLHELNEGGMTIVMITHLMEEAAEASRVVLLERGRIVADGVPGDVLTQTALLARQHLEPPCSVRLAAALAQVGIEVAPSVDEGEIAVSIATAVQRIHQSQDGGQRLSQACSTVHRDVACVTTEQEINALISLEHVFYSYLDRARRRRHERRHTKAGDDRAWGASPDAVWALADVSFEVHDGEFLGIAGHTGSGKSTLIQLMNALITPERGCVRVDGVVSAGRAGSEHARQVVGVVFQYPEHQLFAPTVLEDVAFGPRNLGCTDAEARARARRALARVGLDAARIGDLSPFELSGGQQRRVAIAGVVAMEPRVLVLDEPTAGLDPASRHELLALLDELNRAGTTIVMVSHVMEDLAAHCTRIVVLREGAVACAGTPDDIFSGACDLAASGLDIPATERLARRIVGQGVVLARRAYLDEQSLARGIAAACSAGGDA